MTGTVLTNKGLSLITKLVSAQATLSFSRVAVGTGHTPSGYDPQNMIGLNEYKMDALISSYGVSPDRADVAYLVAQVSSVDVPEGFAITEAGVFATDPDEGEILYAYLDLTEDPQYIYASTDAISKFAEITFNVIIGSVDSGTAIVSPGALVTKKEYDAGMATKVTTAGGDIADTTVSAYTAVTEEYPEPAAGDTIKTIMGKVVKFIQDAKAGFCKKADLVDNCTSTATDKAPTANQVKILWDKIVDVLSALTTHKSSGDHDGRYYTESEINNLLNAKLSISNIVNNLTSTATNMALSAAQGKALNDKINSLNGDLAVGGWTTVSGTYFNVRYRKIYTALYQVQISQQTKIAIPNESRVKNCNRGNCPEFRATMDYTDDATRIRISADSDGGIWVYVETASGTSLPAGAWVGIDTIIAV